MISTIYNYDAQEVPERLETSAPAIIVQHPMYAMRGDAPVTRDCATVQFKTVQFSLRVTEDTKESDVTARMSEEAIAHIWDTVAEDDAWRDL